MANIYCIRCGTKLIPVRNLEWSFECTNCHYKHYHNPKPVVAALLVSDGNVVIVSSKNKDLWGLPGGYISPGENLEEALIREVLEETGLRIAKTEYLASYPLQKGNHHLVFVVFVAEVEGGVLEAGDDVKEAVLLPPTKALEQITGRLARKALETWIHNAQNAEA